MPYSNLRCDLLHYLLGSAAGICTANLLAISSAHYFAAVLPCLTKQTSCPVNSK